MKKINREFVTKVLSVVDKGLTCGIGKPKPGKMCVEAAVAFAAGEDHNDRPQCVDFYLSEIKIDLNDEDGWKSNKSRANGLRRLAISQLGSNGKFNKNKFWSNIEKVIVPTLLAKFQKDATAELNLLFANIKKVKTLEDAAFFEVDIIMPSVNYPASILDVEDLLSILAVIHQKKSKEQLLFIAAELMVQSLIKMKIPGTKFLYLTNKRKRK